MDPTRPDPWMDPTRVQLWDKPARKQNLRSFKVTHFGIAEKPTMNRVSLYNNDGLISKVTEEIANESAAENCLCVYLHSFFVVGSEWCMFCAIECVTADQVHPRSLVFGTNRKGVCDFLLVINSNLGPILYRFWDTVIYWLIFLPQSHLTP